MISDTLHDAISEICQYVKEDGLPHNSWALWETLKAMDELRLALDIGEQLATGEIDSDEIQNFNNFIKRYTA